MNKPPISVQRVARWLFALVALYALGSAAALAFSEQLTVAVAAASGASIFQFLLIVFAAFILRALRWYYLLRKIGVAIPCRDAVCLYFGGFPMAFTPGRIGELWRGWVLATQWRTGYRRALSIVFCDRLLDLNVLLLFAALGVFGASAFHAPGAVAVGACLFLFLLLLSPRRFKGFVKIGYAVCGKRLARHFAALLTVCRHVARLLRPSLYAPLLALSLLAWGMEAIAISIVANGLHGNLPPVKAMMTLGLSNLAGVLTFLPGGVGGQEAVMTYLIQDSGNPWLVAVAVTGIARLGTIFFAALIGFPFFVRLSRRTGEIGE